MAEEKIEGTSNETPDETPATPAEEVVPAEAEKDITSLLLDIQGLLANMQQSMDKLAPVEQEAEAPAEEAPAEETPAEVPNEPVSDEKLEEIDKQLQEN